MDAPIVPTPCYVCGKEPGDVGVTQVTLLLCGTYVCNLHLTDSRDGRAWCPSHMEPEYEHEVFAKAMPKKVAP